jgi:hypothetical protein
MQTTEQRKDTQDSLKSNARSPDSRGPKTIPPHEDVAPGDGFDISSRPPTVIPEYEYSLRDHAVTFGQLVRAHQRAAFDPDDRTGMSHAHAWYYPRLLTETNGAVEELLAFRSRGWAFARPHPKG